MANNKVPITRLGKFFGESDFDLELEMGKEWLHGDMNFTCVLYKDILAVPLISKTTAGETGLGADCC